MIRTIAAILLALNCNALLARSDALPTYIAPTHRAALAGWLKAHPGFRLALDGDCNCDGHIEEVRKGSSGPWKPQPDFHPFYVAGDFNSDGKEDFAVVVLKGAQWYVAVFNAGEGEPAYFGSKGVSALFFGPPRAKPYRLIMGNFEAEGITFRPSGRGYVLE